MPSSTGGISVIPVKVSPTRHIAIYLISNFYFSLVLKDVHQATAEEKTSAVVFIDIKTVCFVLLDADKKYFLIR